VLGPARQLVVPGSPPPCRDRTLGVGLLEHRAKLIDAAGEVDRRLLAEHRRGVVWEVLELAGGVERLERFKEPLQTAEPVFPVLLLLVGENGAAPEDQVGNARLGSDDLAENLAGTLLKSWPRRHPGSRD
jgi:hypothetical protein